MHTSDVAGCSLVPSHPPSSPPPSIATHIMINKYYYSQYYGLLAS